MWILSFIYQLGSMRSMMSQVSGRTGSRSSYEERAKAHESQLYTEVRMRVLFWNCKLHIFYAFESCTIISFLFVDKKKSFLAKSDNALIQFIFLQVGTYKGMLVAIKKLKKERVILSRDDLLELKVVRLNYFDGIFAFV